MNEIDFVELIDEFKQNNLFIEGKISIKNIADLNEHLEFKVEIYPQYPFKNHESESIRFINENLIKYKHVMEGGMLCTHTLQSPKLKDKLLADFTSLKEWIYKYYINKEDDDHYEHIILKEQPYNDIYRSYQFTEVDYEFKAGDFGAVELFLISESKYNNKKTQNFLVQSFVKKESPIKIYNKWSKAYLNNNYHKIGFFFFLNTTPVYYNKFAFNNWLDFKHLLTDDFLDYLNHIKNRKNRKIKVVPIFFGYNINESEIHWISCMIDFSDLPIKAYPVKNNTGIKAKGKWKGKLVDREIRWNITRNSSYKYFFGRGKFCEKIVNSKILIIGLGAIGSMVAKTLVKCGIKNLAITDYDIKEPENVCRSEYTFANGIQEKTNELIKVLLENSPFVDITFFNNSEYFESVIKTYYSNSGEKKNYEKSLNQFDIIFNCSADNDLVYIFDQLNLNSDLINLSITNHANDLVCAFYPNIYNFVQNQFVNVLENDVDDLYKPTGCWSPTFKASYNDINSLVQHALGEINIKYRDKKPKDNFTLSVDDGNNFQIKLKQY